MTDELDPDPKEEREAENLARALERRGGGSDAPDDALEAAALLGYSRHGGTLTDERREAILEELLGAARRPDGRRTKRSWLAWLVPAGGLAAAMIVAVVILREGDAEQAAVANAPSMEPSAAELASGPAAAAPPEGDELPPPAPALLHAQAAAAAGRDDGAEHLTREMETYRGALYAALGARYGR